MNDIKIELENTLGKFLGSMATRNLPFAMASALNDVAFTARTKIISDLPKNFTIRSGKFLSGSIRVTKADMRNLESTVEVADRASFLKWEEFGGTKRARKHRIAVPFNVRTNQTKKIGKAKRPARLLLKPNVFIGLSSRGAVIYQRAKSGKLKALYGLEVRTKYKRTWNFRDTARKVASANWESALNKAMRKALR